MNRSILITVTAVAAVALTFPFAAVGYLVMKWIRAGETKVAKVTETKDSTNAESQTP